MQSENNDNFSPNQHAQHKTFTVAEDAESTRLDVYVNKLMPEYSRTFCQKLISESKILLNGKSVKQSQCIMPLDTISVHIEPAQPLYDGTINRETLAGINIEIIHTEKDFLIINKPAGVMVHKPSPYCTALTVVDWLNNYFHECMDVGHPERPGIVHRLDENTSGLMIIARTNLAHQQFSTLFKTRSIKKEYTAIVEGHPPAAGVIDLPIGRNPIKRNQMTIHGIKPRESLTHYKTLQYFDTYSLVRVQPHTGRTHQIRVHFQAIKHSLIGDSTYGSQSSLINRHALHASQLSFMFLGKSYTFQSPLPEDFQKIIAR